MGAELLLALLFGHAYAVADGGHRVRRRGANSPLTRRQSDYPVANHLSTKRTCQRPKTRHFPLKQYHISHGRNVRRLVSELVPFWEGQYN